MANNLLDKIVEESDLSEEEIQKKVTEKMKEYSGLVSEEGALHLVAKQLEIEVDKEEASDLKVENIVPGMRKVTLKSRVVNIGDIREFERDDDSTGKVRNIILGDETGTVRIPLWDKQTEIGDKLGKDDIIEIRNAYSREDNRHNLELRIGNSTKIEKIDDEDFPEVKNKNKGTSGGGNYQEEEIVDLKKENMKYKISGTILDIYTDNPFYTSCPECNRKVKESEGEYVCDEHGEIEPKKSLAISAVIDDGTENIRCVFFRENAEKFLNVEEKPEEKEGVEEAAEKIIGNTIEIKGNTRYNDYFNRIELISNNTKYLKTEEQIKNMLNYFGD